MLIGERIREIREINKLTMKQFSELFNLSESVISLYESEKRFPSHDVIFKIAKYFSVSIDYIYGNDNQRNDQAQETYTEDEKVIISYYRQLSVEMKSEIKGEMKGIIKTSKEHSTSLEQLNTDKAI